MSSVFISYSHKDKLFAKRLAKDLRKFGHTAWIDEENVLIGDSLIEKICDGIDYVDFVAVIISKASLNSEWAKKELELAGHRELKETRVVILPILLDDVELPKYLVGKCYADFREMDEYENGLNKLLKGLDSHTLRPDLSSEKMMIIKPYLFISTPAHGWLKVPLSELEELGIRNKISAYSYKDSLYAYLEEDCDLTMFIEAKETKLGDEYDVEKDMFTIFVEDFPF